MCRAEAARLGVPISCAGMAPITKGGVEFNPGAVELLEWKAQRDLGAPVPSAQSRDGGDQAGGAGGRSAGGEGRPSDGDSAGGALGGATWGLDGFEPAGHWRRFLRDAHPPRFRAPEGVEVSEVGAGDAQSFGATAAFGLRLPARAEAAFAALPGKSHWRCYVTRSGPAPVAAATFSEGPIVVLAADASAEAGRRSPARAALLHRVIGDSIEAGGRLIAARIDERAENSGDAVAGLLLAGFEKSYLCPLWVDAGLPAS